MQGLLTGRTPLEQNMEVFHFTNVHKYGTVVKLIVIIQMLLLLHKWAVKLASRAHKDISEVLSKKLASQKATNHSYLQKVLQKIIFLSQQGLPLRGNWVPLADSDGGCELESNFHQHMLC